MPSPETVERSARGEVAIGGCVIGDDDPDWECLGCGLRGKSKGKTQKTEAGR
jgi:hypothetical protein